MFARNNKSAMSSDLSAGDSLKHFDGFPLTLQRMSQLSGGGSGGVRGSSWIYLKGGRAAPTRPRRTRNTRKASENNESNNIRQTLLRRFRGQSGRRAQHPSCWTLHTQNALLCLFLWRFAALLLSERASEGGSTSFHSPPDVFRRRTTRDETNYPKKKIK